MQHEDKLKRLIRNVSRSRLTQQGLAEEVQIKEIPGKPLVYSHWMTIILITGQALRITFKTHFKSRHAQLLAAPLYDLPPEQVRSNQAIDCMREYCNLTAGGIKRALLSHMDLHLSLPIVTRGFDELFFTEETSKNTIIDQWILAYRDNQVICTSAIEQLQPVDFANLNEDYDCGNENTTEVEYL